MQSLISPPAESFATEPVVAKKILRALIADDSENDVILVLRALGKAGYETIYERVYNAPAMKAALQRKKWDIVISDYEMPNFGGFEALQVLKASGHDLPFILVSAVVSEETAVAAMKAGAHDYMMKRKLARLGPAIEREMRDAQDRQARRAAEEALRQSEEQLRHTQKMDAVGRLAASVAHDFNNILTAIMGHSELLLRQLAVDDPRRQNAEPIEKCAHMASALTKQLLSFSRKQVIEPRVFDLNEVIHNIEVILRRLLGGDIELQISLDPAGAKIKADPGQLEQVIMNLVVNARDAMPDGGKLTITSAHAPGVENMPAMSNELNHRQYVMLMVEDTGTGMSEEVKAHLFEPFFTTKPLGKGTGLGLATCFGIVKQNHGHIFVESEPKKGTKFKILFPPINLD